ncbi:DUF5916 domain-containing protein [Aquabacterium sp.]|uniref:carbohydrate binding family 9 domain-containing protein n=1 Tax=Aquabacterium sp. TaxID=1872578 RepID=UPI0037835802
MLPFRAVSAHVARWALLLPAVCGLLSALPALAQPPGAMPIGESPIVAVRLQPHEHLKLDGSLSHLAWQRAPVFKDFVQKFPETGAAPSRETRVQVLFDEHAIYVGVTALDDHPDEIRAPLVRHDQVNRTQDFIVVYLDPIGTRQSAQFFRVNAAGSTADGIQSASDDSEDFTPDFDFDAAARRTPQGYTAVFRIPFASLRFATGDQPAWRIMVGRRIPREQFYLETSVLIPREAPSFIATIQPLRGVELPQHDQFLTIRPSLTLRTQRQQAADGTRSHDSGADASLDLKWRPRAEWVIDATLNPDFSQVALDVPQLAGNTRFALSFDEKRPFFFESADLWRSPSNAVYTRSFTEPRWGLRSTWRGQSLAGSALVVDDRGGGRVQLPGPYATEFAEQPASSALVARLRHDLGALQWGGLAAVRRYEGGRGANQVFGPDVAWQIDEFWRMRAQWLHSDTTALPDGHGGLAKGPSLAGDRWVLAGTRRTEDTEVSLTLDDIGAGFRHDSGFVSQNGVRMTQWFLGKGWQPLGPFNEFWLNLHVDLAEDKRLGQRIQRSVYPGFWLVGAHNLDWTLQWHGWSQLRQAATAPLLDERYWKTELVVTPAAWFPFLTLSGRVGRVSDPEALKLRQGGDATVILTTRPLARLEFEPQFRTAWYRQDGQRLYRETAAQVLAVWHFDARQTLRAIVQRTTADRRAEAGIAAWQDAGTQGSLTYAFRKSAGSVLYVGASRSKQGYAQVARGNELFVKLQVDVDELRGLY